MDTQFRTGEGLICEYTGRESKALVRMKANGDGDTWTGWVSRDALYEAMRLLAAVDPQSPPPPPQPRMMVAAAPQQALGVEDAPQEIAPAKPPVPRMVVESPNVVKKFRDELNKLQSDADREDPEPGKHKGVRENDIKEIIWRWRELFRQPKVSMYQIINEIIGMDKDRFEMILKTRPTEAEQLPEGNPR